MFGKRAEAGERWPAWLRRFGGVHLHAAIGRAANCIELSLMAWHASPPAKKKKLLGNYHGSQHQLQRHTYIRTSRVNSENVIITAMPIQGSFHCCWGWTEGSYRICELLHNISGEKNNINRTYNTTMRRIFTEIYSPTRFITASAQQPILYLYIIFAWTHQAPQTWRRASLSYPFLDILHLVLTI